MAPLQLRRMPCSACRPQRHVIVLKVSRLSFVERLWDGALCAMSIVGVQLCQTQRILQVALLLLLLRAACGTTIIRVVSPFSPSGGQFICKGRVLHARAAVSSSSSLTESDRIAFFVDGQQRALAAARTDSEVQTHASIS
jgi:hypothetical protein